MQEVIEKRYLRCACCRGDAGKWLQWHNQDVGFGMCHGCADRIQDRTRPVLMMPSEFRHCYGIAGVNYPAQQYRHEGRLMNVLAKFPSDAIGQQMAEDYQEEFGDVDAQVMIDGRIMLLAYPSGDNKQG